MRGIQGIVRAPQALQKHLLERGGTNPYAEPMYRLVWAASRIVKQGGRWNEWDPSLSVNERGGVQWNLDGKSNRMVPSVNRPRRVVTEMREVRKYGFDGWVLERWMSPLMYGSPTAWNNFTVPDSLLPMLGPYPHQGDYELVAGGEDDKSLPTESALDEAIAQVEAARHRHSGSMETIIRERVNKAIDDYDKELDRVEEQVRLRLREAQKITFGTSLEAGRLRNEIAKRAGVTEHVGN